MNFKFFRAVSLIALFTSGPISAWADIFIKDSNEIVGAWRLESVAPGLEKPKITENRIWEFKADGTIITSGFNRHLGMEDRHEWKYQVANGKILADNPGRPGKPIEYIVYEKTNDTMILKGGIEGYYFFKK
jgi:hypothetical protein